MSSPWLYTTLGPGITFIFFCASRLADKHWRKAPDLRIKIKNLRKIWEINHFEWHKINQIVYGKSTTGLNKFKEWNTRAWVQDGDVRGSWTDHLPCTPQATATDRTTFSEKNPKTWLSNCSALARDGYNKADFPWSWFHYNF